MLDNKDPSIRAIEQTPDGISQSLWKVACFARKVERDLDQLDPVYIQAVANLGEISELISAAKFVKDLFELRQKIDDPRYCAWLDDPSGGQYGIQVLKNQALELVGKQARFDMI